MVDRSDANRKMLNETSDIQNKTKEAIWRIQQQGAEAEGIGNETLQVLRHQGQQMDDINAELESVSSKLDQSSALQSTFDRWAGNWLGGKKASAMKEAAAEIASRNKEDHSKVKEVFQHEKYESITRVWKPSGLVLCTDTGISVDDLFDPALQEKLEKSSWVVDFSLAGIDADGWTYAYDFLTLNKSGAGDSAPKWNSYVRRRKWRYIEKSNSGSQSLNEVRERQNDRITKAASINASKQAEKIGYVPRNKQVSLKESGLASAGMMNRNNRADQNLDQESRAGLRNVQDTDKEIDAGIDAIGQMVDRLGHVASTIKDEVHNQNAKLEKMEKNMSTTTEKQTVVNARQRYLLK